ncbi:MAG: M28 family peptidase [Bacteroidetes bacterium]|nr:M28 family peptidase [Bacteroidota bacterium]
MELRICVFELFLFHFIFTGFISAQNYDSAVKIFSNTILKDELRSHVFKLASPEFEGRETSKTGQRRAAAYIAEQFFIKGVASFYDTSYFQRFPLMISSPDSSSLVIGGKTYKFMRDFYFLPGFQDTVIRGNEICYAGFGISDDKTDEFKNSGAEDRIAVIFAGEPYDREKKRYFISGDTNPSAWSFNRQMKPLNAQRHGVTALLVITDSIEKKVREMKHYIESPMFTLSDGRTDRPVRIPVLFISEEIASDIFAMNGSDLKKVFDKANKGKSKPMLIKSIITIYVRRKKENTSSENIAGFIRGNGKPEEVILITAHYDHLGKDGNEIYYGADDDASGTAAVIEIAEAFAIAKKNGFTPERSILFMPVAGEEKGLLGSGYYTRNPLFPLNKTVADLNIDMIGRMDAAHDGNPDYVYIIGSDKLSTELHKINEEANKKSVNIALDYTYNSPDDPNRFYYRSDHYNFAKYDIPVIFYFTGVHADYHKPTDTPDKIHFEKMEKITRLIFYTAWELANREERIKVDVVNVFEKY